MIQEVQSKYEEKKLYPEQIPRKRFIVFFGSITCREKHTKSLPK